MRACVVAAFALFVFSACQTDEASGSLYDQTTADQRVLDLKWHEDYQQAQLVAEGLGQDLFVLFTGTDWCPSCQDFARDVLEHRSFANWAEDRYVLVRLDFPRFSPMSREQRAANEQVAKRMKIESFPTVIICDPQEARLTEISYYRNGVDAWLNDAKDLMRATAN